MSGHRYPADTDNCSRGSFPQAFVFGIGAAAIALALFFGCVVAVFSMIHQVTDPLQERIELLEGRNRGSTE